MIQILLWIFFLLFWFERLLARYGIDEQVVNVCSIIKDHLFDISFDDVSEKGVHSVQVYYG